MFLVAMLLIGLTAACFYLAFCLFAEKDAHAFTKKDLRNVAQMALDWERDATDARARLHAATDRADSERVMLRDAHRSRLARQSGEIHNLREANATILAELNEANFKIENAFAALGGVADVELEELTLKEQMENAFVAKFGEGVLDEHLPADAEELTHSTRHHGLGGFGYGPPVGTTNETPEVIPFADGYLPSQAREDKTAA